MNPEYDINTQNRKTRNCEMKKELTEREVRGESVIDSSPNSEMKNTMIPDDAVVLM